MSTKADLLYHYTSPEGLKGILSSREIWATSILYLNDFSEFKYTLNLLNGILEKNFGVQLSENLFTRLITTQKEIPWDVYVTAFSEKGDQLDQWRGYCPPTGGFSIGFDKEKLRSYAKFKNLDLENCIYEPDEQTKLLTDIAKEISEVYSINDVQLLRKFISDNRSRFEKIYASLVAMAPRIKHPSFKDENEWRLICYGGSEVLYRVSRSLLVPYLEIGPIVKECFSQIIVGPCPHMDISLRSVKDFANNSLGRGLTAVEVIPSAIPYRNW